VAAWQLSLLLFSCKLLALRFTCCAACDADAAIAVWGAAACTAAGAAAAAAATMLIGAALVLLAFLASLLIALCSLCLDFAAAASSTIGCCSSNAAL